MHPEVGRELEQDLRMHIGLGVDVEGVFATGEHLSDSPYVEVTPNPNIDSWIRGCKFPTPESLGELLSALNSLGVTPDSSKKRVNSLGGLAMPSLRFVSENPNTGVVTFVDLNSTHINPSR